MINLIGEFMTNEYLLISGAYLGLFVTVLLLALFLVKSSRDERGRAIIGKASIVSAIVFIILTNITAKTIGHIALNYVIVANFIQWIYNIVLMVECIAILILKKIS